MKFLGIGPLEFVLMMVVVLLLFKPADIVVGAKKLGQFIGKVKNSEIWNSFRDMRKSVTQAGQNIISDNGLEELKQDLDIMPELDKFRGELEQLGFTPNVQRSKQPLKPLQNDGKKTAKISEIDLVVKK
ncbi:MAG: hypothetical protein HON98_01465 [Chloroflexi bacterium]|jgi:Sec-independent protein translocase protein TatA|nr:hypothetical protein [Chloroflexota bacterium]MBT4306193.1 hypothetical protein [Chloroflexota bacterium]MBT4754336.1 hypothetical protein [Chloroflexota bacterium]MBT6834593.1 hypothetical protein [Bacteroidota bacterium]MBT6988458.1 hypothetical protein [Chloroflexota bacterium]